MGTIEHHPLGMSRLTQTSIRVEDFMLKKPGKRAMNRRTWATLELWVAGLDQVVGLANHLADPKGPHALYIDKKIKQVLNDLKERMDKLNVELTKEFDLEAGHATGRLSLLLTQAGYNLTQLHDVGSLAEDWLQQGAEIASHVLLTRFGGLPRPDRVTTWREFARGVLELPDDAQEQPAQFWNPRTGEQFRLEALHVLTEDHYNLGGEGAIGDEQPEWLPASELRQRLGLPEDFDLDTVGLPRPLDAGMVLGGLVNAGAELLRRGEVLPDIAPEHRTPEETAALVQARDEINHRLDVDPDYAGEMTQRLGEYAAERGEQVSASGLGADEYEVTKEAGSPATVQEWAHDHGYTGIAARLDNDPDFRAAVEKALAERQKTELTITEYPVVDQQEDGSFRRVEVKTVVPTSKRRAARRTAPKAE